MSRIRSIHPGLFTDEAFMALSAHARLLVIGVWTEAFDDGVFEWKPLTLKAKIFPADNVDVPALLEELIAGALVRREEFEGRPIGLVRNFRVYQRPKKPNSSGMLRDEWRTYVGITDGVAEEVPHQFGTDGEKSPQMEDGGGRMEDGNTSPPPVPEPEARALFDEVWKAFPQNPTSNEAKAEKAFNATKVSDRPLILAAALRRRQWFVEDCETRKRTEDEGLKFEPHLSTWITSGDWLKADALPLKADLGKLDPNLAIVDAGSDDHEALKRYRSSVKRPAPYVSERGKITVPIAELEQARAGALH